MVSTLHQVKSSFGTALHINLKYNYYLNFQLEASGFWGTCCKMLILNAFEKWS